MNEKDYLYYFWHNNNEGWLKEFAYLSKDKTLKGLTFGGLTDSKKLVNLAEFNLEELMCALDIIKCNFGSPSGRYHKFNEDYSSYNLKHLVEELLNKITHGRINYISNGTVILAMHHCGFKYQRIPGTPNCYFNVPKKCYKRMTDALVGV
ncbi:MAG: hypothetical protein K2M49_02665 [Muribaculaceae bacterium]|nr:hypothetical protein [Muribaculaceae bacterium]